MLSALGLIYDLRLHTPCLLRPDADSMDGPMAQCLSSYCKVVVAGLVLGRMYYLRRFLESILFSFLLFKCHPLAGSRKLLLCANTIKQSKGVAQQVTEITKKKNK